MLIGIASALALTGCLGGGSESGEHGGGSESGEHNEGSESGEGGEESGTQFMLNETFDEVRAGARLVLSYESNANAFIGTVENTTGATLSQVRVEVHLSNGTELGPTTPVDLAPGQVIDITLPATSQPFASWSAHPEVGCSSPDGVGTGLFLLPAAALLDSPPVLRDALFRCNTCLIESCVVSELAPRRLRTSRVTYTATLPTIFIV